VTYTERWWADQKKALADGTEIEPPWVVEEDSEPFSSQWRLGASQGWKLHIWTAFWDALTTEQRNDYLHRWNCEPVWRLYLMEPEKYFNMEWGDAG
jgi:hypothetical protein